MATTTPPIPLPLPFPYAFEDVLGSEQEGSNNSPFWETLSKVVQHVCGFVIVGLGTVLGSYTMTVALPPLLFAAAALASCALLGVGLWYLFKDLFKGVCQEHFPIQATIDNLTELPANLRGDIPHAAALQRVFEYIAIHRAKWENVLLTNPDWPCDILVVDKQPYLQLRLTIGGDVNKPIRMGVSADNGDLVAISEVKAIANAQASFLQRIIYPNIFESLKECQSPENRGGVLPLYHCLNVDSSNHDNKQQFIIQKLCKGGDLQSLLNAQVDGSDILSLGQKKVIAQDIFEGLLNMHRAGLLHKNLEPANIHCDTRAYLTNFDLTVNPNEVEKDAEDNKDVHYQFKINSKGPLKYQSPETLHCDFYNQKSEVYALGLILYELFKGQQYPDMIGLTTFDEFKAKFPWDDSSLPEGTLDDLLARMLDPDPTERITLGSAFEAYRAIPTDCLILEYEIDHTSIGAENPDGSKPSEAVPSVVVPQE
jgi:serine/threonine protein kinase